MSLSRTLSIAAVALAGLSAPSLAAGPKAANFDTANSIGLYTAEMSVAANADQVRKLLLSQGYSNVSPLVPDRNGRWTGIAMKDGKREFVAVAFPRASPSTN
ncbi:MAG: hypothetical protein AB7U75_02000 [Hyphomicrobiaceae bacterium]